MKNITKSIFALLAIFAISCNSDDVEDRPVIEGVGAPVLLAPEGSNIYTLDIATAGDMVERFVWTPADFGESVEITYTVEIDNAGGDFTNPQSVGSVNGNTQLAITQESLNTAVMALGAEAFVASTFDVRIKAATASDAFAPMYSDVVTITVTPYVAVAPKLYLVGAVQGYYGLNAWDNTTAMEMRYLGDNITKVYEAYVKVAPGDGFKFIGLQGSWDNGNYGTIGGTQDGNLENSGGSGDVKVAETDGAGLYYIWVDIDNMEYKAIKMNWGIIGSATAGGWDNETAMAYDFATNTYSITTPLADGELKFRSANTGNFIAADAWKFNVGNSDPKVTYNPSAPNFAVTGGNHTLGLTVNFDGTAVVTGI